MSKKVEGLWEPISESFRRAPSRMTMAHRPYHFVAIVGGAIAGSVAAEILADNGIHVVVIEQNKKPYGKIEDGLPRWHMEQRKQEYSRIDARLRKPGVFFLPNTRLGRDLTMAAPRRKRNLSSPRSRRKADAHKRSRRI